MEVTKALQHHQLPVVLVTTKSHQKLLPYLALIFQDAKSYWCCCISDPAVWTMLEKQQRGPALWKSFVECPRLLTGPRRSSSEGHCTYHRSSHPRCSHPRRHSARPRSAPRCCSRWGRSVPGSPRPQSPRGTRSARSHSAHARGSCWGRPARRSHRP